MLASAQNASVSFDILKSPSTELLLWQAATDPVTPVHASAASASAAFKTTGASGVQSSSVFQAEER